MKFEVLKTFKTSRSELNKISKQGSKRIFNKIVEESSGIKKEIQNVIKTRQSIGRPYPSRKPTGGIHFASRPGYPPNEDTGDLRRSVKSRSNMAKYFVEISAEKLYAHPLEFGHENVAKRPYFYSTIKKRVKSKSFKQAIFQVTHAVANSMKGELLKKKLRG